MPKSIRFLIVLFILTLTTTVHAKYVIIGKVIGVSGSQMAT